ncbi:ABC transporter substrate-binding protein [Sporolactobacillus sp. THM7-7]|nr:ABC transporter substrate-binding protein [Sporolactobacillus sp. THM7-7]
MKRLNVLLSGVVVICILLYLTGARLERTEGHSGSRTLTIYNWGDYIDPALVKKFEKQTGYQVMLETFDSNEAMYTKVQQGGTAYDLTVPSDYMVEKMAKSHLLIPLDHAKLKGLNHIDSRFMHLSFDPKNKYSIPYFWGTLGIIYNDKFVNGKDVQHWNDLWSPRFKNSMMLVDSVRDIMGLALFSEGKSANTTRSNEVQAAYNKLTKLSPNVKAIIADEIKMYMVKEESPIAVTWSGEAAEMLDGNEHLHYVIPSEGSNIWFDNLVIPKTAKNIKGAYAFINFMMRPENAAQNAEYVGYATPNRTAMALLPKSIKNDRQFYPSDQTIAHLEVYNTLPSKYLNLYNDLFLQFKMH